ncbi:MAG: hypothetical protein ACI4WU_03765 [Bacilli bacterium]
MEKKKVNILVIIIIILCVLLLILGCYIICNMMSSNNQFENNVSNSGNDNQELLENSSACNVKLMNKKEIVFDDITVKVDNGNIKFISGEKEKIFSSVNAKYIYLATYLDSSITKLYYITDDNELYYKNLEPFASIVFFDKEITDYGVKILDNVVGFVDNQSAAMQYDSEGKFVKSYAVLNVLLENGKIYNVIYGA